MSNMLTKRNPNFLSFWKERDPITAIREEMENLLTTFSGEGKHSLLATSCDLTEVNGSYQIKVDLPGLKPEDIDIDVNGDLVTISGERREEKEVKGGKTHRLERSFGSFSRTVRLPCPVKEDRIEALLKEGVLTVTLPKSDEAKSHKVKVKG